MAATADMQFLIDRLDGMLQQSRRAFFGGRVQLDEAELQQIVDGMRAAYPPEVKQARRVLQEREHIIKNAQDEAEKVAAMAKQQAEFMTSDHGLLIEARQRAEQMLREAEEERDSVEEGARRYALDVIVQVNDALGALEAAVGNNRGRVRHIMEQLQEPPTA